VFVSVCELLLGALPLGAALEVGVRFGVVLGLLDAVVVAAFGVLVDTKF